MVALISRGGPLGGVAPGGGRVYAWRLSGTKGKSGCGAPTMTYGTFLSLLLISMGAEAENKTQAGRFIVEHPTLLALAALPNIVGVKDSTGDFNALSLLLREAPSRFEVYGGDDWASFSQACLGASGVVSVASHLVGSRIHEMLELVEHGDVPAARKIHDELSPVFDVLFITSNPIPAKAALELVGRPVGPPRLPLVPATQDERERIRKVLEEANLL